MVTKRNLLLMARSVFLLLVLISMNYINVHSQGFSAGVIAGINTSQIDGDLLYGFNKPGIQTGLSVSYPYSDVLDFTLEMLYCQRGSQDRFAIGGNNLDRARTSLNYISLPLLAEFKFGGQDKRIKVYPGLAYSYLVSGSTPGNRINTFNNFKRSDFSYLAGVSYAVSSSIWIGMRYTRGLQGIYNITGRDEDALISYFLNFRLEIDI